MALPLWLLFPSAQPLHFVLPVVFAKNIGWHTRQSSALLCL
jgi:hypothetical protein